MVDTSIWNGPSASLLGAGIVSRMASKSGVRSLRASRAWRMATPSRPTAYRNGQSSWWSSASSSMNSSSTSSCTRCGSASPRSILLMTTIGCSPSSSALRVTKRVCGMGPSAASTSRTTPSTMRRMRSTSPPKSEWPGVSTMLILVSAQRTDRFLARMVIPRSRSSGLESITRSCTCWFSRKVPAWRSMWSTSVVLPWSTWAMMAMLRIGMLYPSDPGAWMFCGSAASNEPRAPRPEVPAQTCPRSGTAM